ncbi:MAG: ABC transporter permease [Bdellovibrionaceae bacterium]|nr:ABC transporter permease [Pseudobdellovibrionaceae bacterium]
MNLLKAIGECVLFIREGTSVLMRHGVHRHEVFNQIWRVTSQSLPTTAVAGFFVGAVMTVQFTLQVKAYGALGYLGGLSTSGTVRQVGPLLIAFMLSGKVGAFTAAELGTMRVTEQIDAIRCLGANPFQEIIIPRVLAIIASSFALLSAGLLMSIFGGLLLAKVFAGINADEYLRHIPTLISWPSIALGLFKCLVFAVVLATICTFKGYNASGGARGVGRAVVETAVSTMVALVVADWGTSLLADALLVLLSSMIGRTA